MDLEKEISKALSDPEIMGKVSDVLSNLGSGGENGGDNIPQNGENAISGLLSNLGGGINDERTRLLLAIKPFLSEKRAPYMDSAITILKLVSMGKIGKDLNLF